MDEEQTSSVGEKKHPEVQFYGGKHDNTKEKRQAGVPSSRFCSLLLEAAHKTGNGSTDAIEMSPVRSMEVRQFALAAVGHFATASCGKN